ncbi:lipopolysaccharide biosynthesis protein [Lacticaseibacillus paracasei]|uniref:lipopolysaccharide biosynthesis protein n=1 Tax=Lacticaseibacillus paracasei TaxID=1597 RepID=UPI0008DD2532|nr:oligosaccharide flippase family protein [Lacticaseibacillus paracasei]OHY56069.1 hypothetical protein BBX46_02420 [Lacticaseibacillus paracasei]
MKNNRYSRLLGNSALFAIANLGTKLIQFLMVPLYTYALTVRQYGVVDLLLTTVTMLTPIVSLSVFDAVFRFSMDKDHDLSAIFSNGVLITLAGFLIVLIISPVNLLVRIPYYSYFLGILFFSAINSLLQNFAKSIGYVKQFAFSGFLNAVLVVLLNLLLLVVFKLGVVGYVYGILFASAGTAIYLAISIKAWKFIDLKKLKFKYCKKLLQYSAPLIPNSFSWWFTNDANRYFILFFVGAAGNGLYAVANKIPSILTVFFSIFTQAWQLSAVEEFESKDNGQFYSNIFNYLIFISSIGISGILIILKPFMQVYTSPSFYSSWHFAPFLLMAAVFANLSAFLGTVFIAAKKTGQILSTTVVGMLINLGLNLLLIPLLGVNGAGIGSGIGFLVVTIIRFRKSKQFVEIVVDKFLLINVTLVVALMISAELLVKETLMTIGLTSGLLIILIVLERSYVMEAGRGLRKIIQKVKGQ